MLVPVIAKKSVGGKKTHKLSKSYTQMGGECGGKGREKGRNEERTKVKRDMRTERDEGRKHRATKIEISN